MIQTLMDGGRLSDKKLICARKEGTEITMAEVTQ